MREHSSALRVRLSRGSRTREGCGYIFGLKRTRKGCGYTFTSVARHIWRLMFRNYPLKAGAIRP